MVVGIPWDGVYAKLFNIGIPWKVFLGLFDSRMPSKDVYTRLYDNEI